MAEVDNEIRSFLAGEAITKRNVVKLGTTANYVLVADDDDAPLGVAKYTVASGEVCEVITEGTVEVIADGSGVDRLTSTKPTLVCSGTSGVVKALPSSTGDYYTLGEVDAVEGNTSASGKMYVKINRQRIYVHA